MLAAVPQSVNYSMMCGAVLTWGILWPIFNTKAGVWYPAGASPHPAHNSCTTQQSVCALSQAVSLRKWPDSWLQGPGRSVCLRSPPLLYLSCSAHALRAVQACLAPTCAASTVSCLPCPDLTSH